MSTGTILDLAFVLILLALCGVWIWWDEKERRKRKLLYERQLKAIQELMDSVHHFNQESDSGSKHTR
jgi:hypothetical protein